MFAHLRPALVMIALMTVLTGVIYPLAVTAIAQLAMSSQANGSLRTNGKIVVGSTLIGQSFAADHYFHNRPSATSAPDPKEEGKTIDAPYNASNSSGSNLGPLSKKLLDRVGPDAAALRASSGLPAPADAVTTSASGLDPHISPANAAQQVARVAAARQVSEDRVRQILQASTERPALGLFGEPRVNVLLLNLALDAALGSRAG